MEVGFVVEDGSGISDATSYATIDELKQYWFDQEYSYTNITTVTFSRILNKATSYIDNNYRNGFPGHRQYDTQALEWPRTGAYYLDYYDIDEETIPTEVKNAVFEAAYLIQSGIDLTATISKSGKVSQSSVKVDVIEEAYSYETGSVLYSDIYTIIDDALSRITGGVSDKYVIKALRVGGESP